MSFRPDDPDPSNEDSLGDFGPEDITGGSPSGQLPLFETLPILAAEVALSGKLSGLSMYEPDTRALMEALSLGRMATIAIAAGGRRVEILARVETRAHRLKDGSVTTVARLKLDPSDEP